MFHQDVTERRLEFWWAAASNRQSVRVRAQTSPRKEGTTMNHEAAEHHKKAADHHEHAAAHHREAAEHHEQGNHEKAVEESVAEEN